MARLTLAPGDRSPETHYFLAEGSPSRGLPLPASVAKRLPAAGGESVWIDGGKGRTLVVHRYKTSPSLLIGLRLATRRAADSMKRRGISRARFVFTKDAVRVARALLPHLELCDYEFSRYRKNKKISALSVSLDLPGARISAADLSSASAVASSAPLGPDLRHTPAHHLRCEELNPI